MPLDTITLTAPVLTAVGGALLPIAAQSINRSLQRSRTQRIIPYVNTALNIADIVFKNHIRFQGLSQSRFYTVLRYSLNAAADGMLSRQELETGASYLAKQFSVPTFLGKDADNMPEPLQKRAIAVAKQAAAESDNHQNSNG